MTFSKIKTKEGKEYDVKIVFGLDGRLSEKSGCTCKYGAFYRWSKANKKDKFICRHMLSVYSTTTKQSHENARNTLIKQGILNKDHLIKK